LYLARIKRIKEKEKFQTKIFFLFSVN